MMKRLRRSMMLVCAFSLFTFGSIYAAEPTEVPSGAQTGDEVMAAKATETMRGKLLKVQDTIYTVETAPGTQASIRAENNTKFEGGYKGSEGDWIEALVTPDMQIKSLKRSIPAYTVEGDVLTASGDTFVVRDSGGKEIRLQIGKNTKVAGTYKVGDRIKAEYAPDGRAISVKPSQITRGPGGG